MSCSQTLYGAFAVMQMVACLAPNLTNIILKYRLQPPKTHQYFQLGQIPACLLRRLHVCDEMTLTPVRKMHIVGEN